MRSVAQKTLLTNVLTFNLIICCLFLMPFNAFGSNYENTSYNIYLNKLKIGKGSITYTPNAQNTAYKFLAKAKTSGFIKSIYSINNSISVNGLIQDKQLVPLSHTLVLKENSYKANKTASFNYEKDLIKMVNNRNNKVYNYILLNNAKDIFSTLFELKFNTDLSNPNQEFNFDKTIQMINKTVANKIYVSKAFDYKISKKESIKAREVTIESKRIRHKKLTQEMLAKLKIDKNIKPISFFDDLKDERKQDVFEKNIKVIVSSDERKIPLVIEYKTKFGTFKAIATDF